MALWTKKMPNSNYQVELEMTQSSQSIAGNYSNVAWAFRIRKLSGRGYWNNDASTWSASIGGNNHTGSGTYDFRSSSVKTLLSGTQRINHASNGTGSVTGSTWFTDNGRVLGNAGNSGHVLTLSTIPRASSFSLSGGTTTGSTVNVAISRATSSFTHKVWWKMGSGGWNLITSSATTSTSFSVPHSALPSSTSGTITVAVQTMSGSTNIGGEVHHTRTITVPSNIVPSASSISHSEGGTHSGLASAGTYIRGYTRLNLAINGASAGSGSSIKSYKIVVDGHTIYARTGTTGTIQGCGASMPVTATVTDNRNRSTSISTTVYVRCYDTPKINSVTTYRANSNGSRNDSGTYVYMAMNYTLADYVGGTYQYQLSAGSNNTWVTTTPGTKTVSAVFSGFSVNNTYSVNFYVKDGFGTVQANGRIPTGETTMHWGKDWASVGGRMPASHKTPGTLYAQGQIYQNNGEKVASDTGSHFKDTRSVNSSPEWYFTNFPKQVVREFKSKTTIGIAATGTYVALTTQVIWGDQSGGYVKQVVIDDNANTSIRTGVGSSWGAWRETLTNAHIKDYIVERGSNSRGTWVKYESGVMEQWGKFDTSATTSTTFGSGFRTGFITQSYPIAFANTNDMNGTLVSGNLTAGSMQSMRVSDFTWTAMTFDSPNRGVSEVRYHVVGRWK